MSFNGFFVFYAKSKWMFRIIFFAEITYSRPIQKLKVDFQYFFLAMMPHFDKEIGIPSLTYCIYAFYY